MTLTKTKGSITTTAHHHCRPLILMSAIARNLQLMFKIMLSVRTRNPSDIRYANELQNPGLSRFLGHLISGTMDHSSAFAAVGLSRRHQRRSPSEAASQRVPPAGQGLQ